MVQNRAVDEAVFNVTEAIRNAADAAIPRTSNSPRKLCKPWWNASCQQAKKGAKEGVGYFQEKISLCDSKAIQGIGGDPKSVKKLRSGDLLLETVSALQTKSFLLAKTFLDCPLKASPHKSLNSSRGVISEPDLICTPEAEILEGFSGQGVIQSCGRPGLSGMKLCLMFFTFGMMTQRTASWKIWHLERGFELLRTFGLVRWGLGGGGHVEGTGEKLSFASQAAR
ncbi:putative RNA-directed DNA polymerase from transposon BS [Trichonephila clavipes]|nr:putative RNA-directed DNA polymerase from transposon BS [Trichonephila clavipes]